MPTEIGLEEVRRLADQGVPLVEVLSSDEYEEEHIAGAVNVPLGRIDEEATSLFRKDEPIIVYCYDAQ